MSLSLLLFGGAPRDPEMIASVGAAGTPMREVTVVLSSSDLISGFSNVTEMKIWGDLDPGFLPERFAAEEEDAQWQPFATSVPLVVSVGDGDKEINAKLRNPTGAETETMTVTVTLDVAKPHVSLLWRDDQRLMHFGRTFEIGWSCTHAFDEYVVLMAPSPEASLAECYPLDLEGPAGAAGEMMRTVIDVDDAHDNDPNPTQQGSKWVTIMVLINGEWYGGFVEEVLVSFPEFVWDESNWDEGVWE